MENKKSKIIFEIPKKGIPVYKTQEQREGEAAYKWLDNAIYAYHKNYSWPGRTLQELLMEYTPQEIFAVCERCGHKIVNGIIVH